MTKPYKKFKVKFETPIYKNFNILRFFETKEPKDGFLKNIALKYDFYINSYKHVLYDSEKYYQKYSVRIQELEDFNVFMSLNDLKPYIDETCIDEENYKLLCLPKEFIYTTYFWKHDNFNHIIVNDSYMKSENDKEESNIYIIKKHKIDEIEIDPFNHRIHYCSKEKHIAKINILKYDIKSIQYDKIIDYKELKPIYIESSLDSNRFGSTVKNKKYNEYIPKKSFNNTLLITNDVKDLINMFAKHYFEYNLKL